MRTLYAHFVGEFGHEIACFHGRIRRLSKSYDHTTICCFHGHEIFYEDFADEIISIDKPNDYEPDCHNDLSKFNYNIPFNYTTVIKPREKVLDMNDTQLKNKQDFVKFGKNNKDGFDIIIHARDTDKTNSEHYNWSHNKWDSLCDKLVLMGYSVASIGTNKMSYSPSNVIDLRDISLDKLSNILSSSKIIVGGASGAMHFATMCGLPQIVWSGLIRSGDRFINKWNFFDTSVIYFDEPKWDPQIDFVYSKIRKFLTKNF